MPLYEYQCKKCKHRFEKIQTYSDKPIKKCPECGGAVEKLLSAPAIQFKGSGWYVNDYAKKSGSASDGEGSSAKTPAESKAEDKSAAKSDGDGGKSAKESKPKSEASSSGKKKK
jgi:putative FmdB family regulatory protein